MSHLLSRFRPRRPGPALAFCALALIVFAIRLPAAAALPAGLPLAWGQNDRGELGNGTLNDSSFPVAVSNLSNVVAVDGGVSFSIALKADGSVWTWGRNDYGQLGNGTYTDSTVPVRVSNLTNVVAVSGGSSNCLALKSDGTVVAWGDNYEGRLGIGSFGGTRSTPVQVSNLSGVVAIRSSGPNLALKADGTVWAWGDNNYGQLGDGTFTNRSTPVRVANLPSIAAIGVGGRHSLALAPDGTVWAWGDNSLGQFGDGTFTSRASPALGPNLTGVVAICDGGGQSQVLRSDGTVWMWGRNSSGQLGRGTITGDSDLTNALPGQVVNTDGTVFGSIVAIAQGSLAIKSDGSVWAWGGNAAGQVGNGTTNPDPPYAVPNPVPVLGSGGRGFLTAPVAFGCGSTHRLAVDLAAPYSWSGVLQPVNADGTSVFKRNSTVQLKFKLTNESAGITDAQARFGYAQINSLNPGSVNESTSNAAGTSGILFVYDAASGEYRYNWNTKGLGIGRYLLRIDLGDGVMRTVVVGLN